MKNFLLILACVFPSLLSSQVFASEQTKQTNDVRQLKAKLPEQFALCQKLSAELKQFSCLTKHNDKPKTHFQMKFSLGETYSVLRGPMFDWNHEVWSDGQKVGNWRSAMDKTLSYCNSISTIKYKAFGIPFGPAETCKKKVREYFNQVSVKDSAEQSFRESLAMKEIALSQDGQMCLDKRAAFKDSQCDRIQ
jgi:hypothetical protein